MKETWFSDSEASSHMRPCKVGMCDFVDESPSLIKMANRNAVSVEGHSSIDIMFWPFGAPRKMTLTYVRSTPVLSFNHFYLRTATDLGHTCQGKIEGMMLYPKRRRGSIVPTMRVGQLPRSVTTLIRRRACYL